MAEDDDYSQDSEAYRKWRSGEDNDRYASSRNPTETGSKSGSYSIPQSNDEYALPGEEDNSRGGSWLDGDISWPAIIAAFLVFALISAVVFAFVWLGKYLLTSKENEILQHKEMLKECDEERKHDKLLMQEMVFEKKRNKELEE